MCSWNVAYCIVWGGWGGGRRGGKEDLVFLSCQSQFLGEVSVEEKKMVFLPAFPENVQDFWNGRMWWCLRVVKSV